MLLTPMYMLLEFTVALKLEVYRCSMCGFCYQVSR